MSPDGRWAISANGIRAYLWDLTSGEQTRQFELRPPGWFASVAFSSDGMQVLLGTSRGEAFLYEAASGQLVNRIACQADVRAVAFSPVGRQAATASGARRSIDNKIVADDCRARLWDLSSGTELFRSADFEEPITTVLFTSDGSRLLYANPKSFGILDVENKRETVSNWDKKLPPIQSVAFAPDGRFALIGGQHGELNVYDLMANKPGRWLKGHTDLILCSAIAQDGSCAVSCGGTSTIKAGIRVSSDCTVRLWDLGTGQELARFEKNDDLVSSVVLTRDGTRALAAWQNGSIRLLDLSKLLPPPGRP